MPRNVQTTIRFVRLLPALFAFVMMATCPAALRAQDTLQAGNAGIPERWVSSSLAAPPKTGTTDLEGAYSAAQKKVLDSLVTDLYFSTGIRLYLVTTDSTWTSRENYDRFGLHLLQRWFITAPRGTDGGIVLVSKTMQKIRFFSNQSLQELITQNEMKDVIEKGFIPGYAKGQFYTGSRDGLMRLISRLKQNWKIRQESVDAHE